MLKTKGKSKRENDKKETEQISAEVAGEEGGSNEAHLSCLYVHQHFPGIEFTIILVNISW